jgi:dTDP-4-amino-4,6-dideoxygalactose transaminase
VDAIQEIADSHGLKVIYDAAHAFGVRCHCGSVLKHGNLSILSLHATKVFNTFEGGAIICPDLETKIRIDQLKNFGFDSETSVIAPGLNGKMSEFNAAFGLLQLKYVDQVMEKRKAIEGAYRLGLADINGIRCLPDTSSLAANYAYLPILIGPEFPMTRDELYERLKSEGIHARRYFYPLISEFSIYRGLPSAHRDNLPVASQAASQVLCLPIFPGLSLEKVDKICQLIRAR